MRACFAIFRILREAAQLLWHEADAYSRRRLALAFVYVIAAATVTAITPIAFKLAVDSLTTADRAAHVTLFACIAAYVAGLFATRVLNELRVRAHGCAEQRLHRRLSHRLFLHVIRLPLSFHLDRPAGSIGQTLTNGLSGYEIILRQWLYALAPVLIELATITVILLQLNHPIYLGLLSISAVAYMSVFAAGARRVTEPARAGSAARRDAQANLTDALVNAGAVKYFTAEQSIAQDYDSALAQTEGHFGRLFQQRTTNGLLAASLFAASLGSALTLATREVLQGSMNIGDWILIHAYVIRLAQPLEAAGYAMREIAQGVAYLEHMLALFRESPESHATVCDFPFRPRGAITFDGVSFSYKQRLILKNISFHVPIGGTVALVGSSGSGKSTVGNLLLRFYEPNNGRILIDGVPLAEIPPDNLRGFIGVVPQDTPLFNKSLAHNIGFGKPDSTQVEIEKAAQLAHLHEFITSLPEGYRTKVGERGLKLSGGERQRVAIARAALKRPRIYLFDEATSSLDSKTERAILANLDEVSRGCTRLVIAHRLSTVMDADEILVMEAGEIIERGTHDALLAMHGHYARLWTAQMRGSSAEVA